MPPHQDASSRRNETVRRGIKLQPRDLDTVWMAGTHGYVTMPQIRLFAFEGWDETGWWRSVSEQAVYRRLKKLCEAGLLEHQRTWYGDHGIYRTTRAGLELTGLEISPARLDKRDYEHDLRVVDLALELTDYELDGWIPERMIRSRLKVGTSIGRVPDGLYIGPGGERWAVELEVSGKESQRYYDACRRYAGRHRIRIPDGSADWEMEEYVDDYVKSGGEMDGVVWYFLSEKKRQRALAEANKVVAARSRQRERIDHLNLRFHGAGRPGLPPFQKWEEQQRHEREAEEQRRREAEEREQHKNQKLHEQRERARRDYLYAWAVEYLGEDEERRVYEALFSESGRQDRYERIHDSEIKEAVIEAAAEKHRMQQEKDRIDQEKKEKRRQRRDSVKSWITGR